MEIRAPERRAEVTDGNQSDGKKSRGDRKNRQSAGKKSRGDGKNRQSAGKKNQGDGWKPERRKEQP